MGIISVEGIKLHAYHGCFKEEQMIGCEYTVDIKIKTSLEKSILTDALEDTVDYTRVYDIVKQEMSISSKLIEHVAGRILNRLEKELKASKFEVKVNKFNPPVHGEVKCVSVKIKSKDY